MATISAYAPEALKREVERVAQAEGRNQAQVATTALELYTSLSSAARAAFLEARAAGALDRVLPEMERVLISVRWDLLSQRIDREIEERGSLPEGDPGEDEISAIALEMTSDPDGRKRRATG